ncbi:MAG: aminoacyl-tRNA hydrolase [Bacteroidales bacterium]|jgi:PTH1 family peptidyl-tRNA hydrolase|nr:aminoacyl-tRNA hydrolase [Bacteroidales bacterium]
MNGNFLIVGLGNIGREYDLTRHNVGFEVVDYMAQLQEITFAADRYAHIATFKLKGNTVILAKPTTYMNLSGKAVRYQLEKHGIEQKNLLVIADDKDLPLGTLRLKPKGTGGTHNGINHIVETLNSVDFPRLKVGIGNDFAKGFQVQFVLSKFTIEEIKIMQPCLKQAVEMVQSFVTQGIDRTMNLYNKK